MRYLFDEGGSSQPPLVFERKECPFLHCKEFFSPCRVGRCVSSWLPGSRFLRIIYNSRMEAI
ncbi:hypothetical protein PITC_097550 [Penicillium italicum]|uniref:Uncharacterized protein n=1 Tax=Penicillium italicum TaxID=40296 RepID=A0A0A2L203_PENIT|nr:hypothetical protein PITC_097550 [Penicillium italicum]